MHLLVGNTVKTARSDYFFPTREEAEAFYLMLKSRAPAPAKAAVRSAAQPRPGKRGAHPTG